MLNPNSLLIKYILFRVHQFEVILDFANFCGCLLSPVHLQVPMFNRENYCIWTANMKFVLRYQSSWNVLIDPPPLRENLTIVQIKTYEEEKLTNDKPNTCLHAGLVDHIFTKIMDMETPKRVGKELRLFTLKREFELMKVKNNAFVKNYFDRLMDVMNQM
uniref:Uncharacterized protein n=1 Tax=Cajanus cajan TaxID=3821 RepID=A0A151SAD1_CAJCA|nr:hypothetical protein KK1_026427 [Cajanus cajan]